MSQSFRLANGGRIERGRTLSFRFDGRVYQGHPGDTLASALLANGVSLVGRSFKRRRPRGVMALGVDEPNALVGVAGAGGGRFTPNTLATTQELYEGLDARSQNRWPSLALDLGGAVGPAAPLLTAGFYYKTFMWPRSGWRRLYEPALRRMAGLGEAPTAADPDAYASRYGHCDLLVVGGGPAGIAAARAAAGHGLNVVLCEQDFELGGSLLGQPETLWDGRPAWDALAGWKRELARGGVSVMTRTTVFGAFAHNLFGLSERLTDHQSAPEGPRERLWFLRARAVVLAAGAIERPLVFADNDRPGVMLASAAAGYAGRFGVAPGGRAVVCARDDSAYAAAMNLRRAGLAVSLADARAEVAPELVARAAAADIPVEFGVAPVATRGARRVSAVGLVRRDGERPRWVDCDLVAMAGGWTPTAHLHSQAGGRLAWDDGLRAFVPTEPRPGWAWAGACTGSAGLAEAIADGVRAGELTVRRLAGLRETSPPPAARAQAAAPRRVPPTPGGPAFVDFQNDVTASDLAQAMREGFRSIEHIKRYTTTGMATDQGRTSNVNALELAAALAGRDVPAVGHTTFRAPYTPVTLGALAGRHRGALFEPLRTTPTDGWAEARGAAFENVGLWRRARYFPQPGEGMQDAVARECLATRTAAGLFDASTLGKIEVVGPDAAEFLNRLYVNAWSKLAPGRCRYGVMLRESGYVFDDGVIGRIAEDRFHVTTTTGGAPQVLHHMEDYLQTEFPELRVWLTSTTEQWGVIAVNGPAARRVIAPLVEGIDLSPEAFPHMSVATGRICGVPCRLFRVSFTGELGFEINVRSGAALAVWEAVHAAGAPEGLTPYGTEAMHVLRAEKGYIIVGQETDGTVTPDDVGLGWAIGRKKRDFVGKRSLVREDLARLDRPQMIGLLAEDRRTVLEEGAQLVSGARDRTSQGHVTSAYWSATLGQPIALALLRGGRARLGESLVATSLEGRPVRVRVVEPVFHDPAGARLDA